MNNSFPLDLMARLDDEAETLNMHLACGEYVDGEEREMAKRLAEDPIVVTPGAYEVITWLVWDKVSTLAMVELPLDETDTATYEVIEKAAKILSDAIIREGHASVSVEVLLTNAISNRAELARDVEAINARH